MEAARRAIVAKPIVRTIRGKIGGCRKQRVHDWSPLLDGRQIVFLIRMIELRTVIAVSKGSERERRRQQGRN